MNVDDGCTAMAIHNQCAGGLCAECKRPEIGWQWFAAVNNKRKRRNDFVFFCASEKLKSFIHDANDRQCADNGIISDTY